MVASIARSRISRNRPGTSTEHERIPPILMRHFCTLSYYEKKKIIIICLLLLIEDSVFLWLQGPSNCKLSHAILLCYLACVTENDNMKIVTFLYYVTLYE
jgi:hypothetical protein